MSGDITIRTLLPAFRYFIVLACGLYIYASQALGQPFDPDLKKCVMFMRVSDTTGWSARATGFIIGTKCVYDSTNQHPFFVTCRHSLRRKSTGQLADSLQIMVSSTWGTIKHIDTPISKIRSLIFEHPDSTVDLVALPLNIPTTANLDHVALPHHSLVTKDQFITFNIREGLDVFSIGLFSNHLGSTKIQPIPRFGKISYIADEPITWKGRPSELILLDCFSLQGNSGSPVFVPDASRQPNGYPFVYLLGIVRGSYYETASVKWEDEVDPSWTTKSNMGLSAVTPIYKLRELFDTNAVQNFCISIHSKKK